MNSCPVYCCLMLQLWVPGSKCGCQGHEALTREEEGGRGGTGDVERLRGCVGDGAEVEGRRDSKRHGGSNRRWRSLAACMQEPCRSACRSRCQGNIYTETLKF